MTTQYRLVKKPKKTYRCDACAKLIDGAHIYAVGKVYGDFVYGRFHLECNHQVQKMCGECRYNDDCQSTIEDCYFEMYLKEKKQKGGDQ